MTYKLFFLVVLAGKYNKLQIKNLGVSPRALNWKILYPDSMQARLNVSGRPRVIKPSMRD